MNAYPDFLVIPHQLVRDERLQPLDRILYGVIYWYAKMKMERCFASNATLAKLCGGGTGERSVRASLERLESCGFIQRSLGNGTRSEIAPLVVMGVGANEPGGRRKCAGGVGANAPQSSNSYNKTNEPKHRAEGAEVVRAFEAINPAAKLFYANTTQRKACDDLIDEYGLERVLSVVSETLPKTNAREYLPTIVTPLQLFEKWAALEAGIHKLKGKQDSVKKFVVI